MSHVQFCILAKVFIQRLTNLLNITRLWLTTKDLTELSTMIIGVVLNFYLLSTVRVHNRSFQSHLKPGRPYALRQLSESTTITFRATKIFSVIIVDNPVNRRFPSYINPDHYQSWWHSCMSYYYHYHFYFTIKWNSVFSSHICNWTIYTQRFIK